MSRWFRHYAGMMRDEKLVRVAVKVKQPVERVIWVWGAILESAAEINNGGRYEFDIGEAAYFLRCNDDDMAGVLAGLEAFGHLANGVVSKWGDRQYVSDGAAERQRRYRERVKDRDGDARGSDGDAQNRESDVTRYVTPPSRDGAVTAQETDTDTEERSLSETSSDAKPKARKKRVYPPDFEAIWLEYPTDPNMSKADAFDAYRKLDAADQDALAASIRPFREYCRARPDYRPKHMDGFIKSRRFDGFQPQKPASPVAIESRWTSRLKLARADHTWSSSEWGPRPGEEGCLVPPHLLEPTDGQGWCEWSSAA